MSTPATMQDGAAAYRAGLSEARQQQWDAFTGACGHMGPFADFAEKAACFEAVCNLAESNLATQRIRAARARGAA